MEGQAWPSQHHQSYLHSCIQAKCCLVLDHSAQVVLVWFDGGKEGQCQFLQQSRILVANKEVTISSAEQAVFQASGSHILID